jgi:hypothetical protein
MAPWQPGLASQRQPQPSPDKLSHADPVFGAPEDAAPLAWRAGSRPGVALVVAFRLG